MSFQEEQMIREIEKFLVQDANIYNKYPEQVLQKFISRFIRSQMKFNTAVMSAFGYPEYLYYGAFVSFALFFTSMCWLILRILSGALRDIHITVAVVFLTMAVFLSLIYYQRRVVRKYFKKHTSKDIAVLLYQIAENPEINKTAYYESIIQQAKNDLLNPK